MNQVQLEHEYPLPLVKRVSILGLTTKMIAAMHEILFLLILIGGIECVGDTVDPSLSPSNPQVPNPPPDKCQNRTRNCSDLSNLCLNCKNYDRDINCKYGEWLNVTCSVPEFVNCSGDRKNIDKRARCIFCYQTELWEQTCYKKSSCVAGQVISPYFKTNCTVNHDVMCIGNRNFQRKLKYNWTCGHKWSTAMLLSITLGGFGADRFYLGHWQEGIGKLFSFGGLGVWTLVDVLLIAIRYLGPADGSFYV